MKSELTFRAQCREHKAMQIWKYSALRIERSLTFVFVCLSVPYLNMSRAMQKGVCEHAQIAEIQIHPTHAQNHFQTFALN